MSKTLANKLPVLAASFWVMKICATTLGETAGDLLSMTLHVGYGISSLILISVFALTLAAQLAARGFHPALYWLVILSTSTAGTTISDFMDRTLALGYATGSAILLGTLMLVLALWRICVGTISVRNITSRTAEVFYWAAILVSNTLGTALGDYWADDSGLGFAGGAAVIGGALVLLFALYKGTAWSRVGLFWAAFILTRPFGATIGDLLTKSHEKGGLDFGTVGSSMVLLAVLVFSIVITHVRQQKKPQEAL